MLHVSQNLLRGSSPNAFFVDIRRQTEGQVGSQEKSVKTTTLRRVPGVASAKQHSKQWMKPVVRIQLVLAPNLQQLYLLMVNGTEIRMTWWRPTVPAKSHGGNNTRLFLLTCFPPTISLRGLVFARILRVLTVRSHIKDPSTLASPASFLRFLLCSL